MKDIAGIKVCNQNDPNTHIKTHTLQAYKTAIKVNGGCVKAYAGLVRFVLLVLVAYKICMCVCSYVCKYVNIRQACATCGSHDMCVCVCMCVGAFMCLEICECTSGLCYVCLWIAGYACVCVCVFVDM
jgi:hypothetical protein